MGLRYKGENIADVYAEREQMKAEVDRLQKKLSFQKIDGDCLEAENKKLSQDQQRLEWMAANGAEIFDDWGDDLATELPLAKRWRVSWVQKTMGRWVVKEVWACDWRPAMDEAMSNG